MNTKAGSRRPFLRVLSGLRSGSSLPEEPRTPAPASKLLVLAFWP